MKKIYTNSKSFKSELDAILKRGALDLEETQAKVAFLIDEVKLRGEEAIFEHISKFDKWNPKSIDDIKIKEDDCKRAYDNLDRDIKNALHFAYERIESFHKLSAPKSWMEFDKDGTMLGQKVTPIDCAGLYIPGGKAAYPSSLLMNAIPAIVAGVEDIIVCTPTPQNEPNLPLLGVAYICGLKNIYKVGGASAIGAMAYGTQNIKKCSVITGPGNIFVAAAKKRVFGDVNIDMIAGPSEILIIADESADPRMVAIDLLSQAEHDEMASSILITHNENLAKRVEDELERELVNLERVDIAKESINNRAAIIITQTVEESIEISNILAPEHLEVMVSNPLEYLPFIKNAGAIFLGNYTPEAIGDYVAGPNHTLPTGGSAKFFSPLSVENFVKKSSILSFSKEGMNKCKDACAILAQSEGLDAHKKSVLYRF